ncbi:MAG: ABC transporter permease [Deltaproteobacteria bacterium]|nr:ABC transporter permease [Deltaproteobacteria bacterium]
MDRSARLRLLVALAFRSLSSHRVKSLIVGAIMAFGTFVVVLGTALLDSVEYSMSHGIIGSLAGHFQVYSKDARDDLALFGGAFMGSEDIGRIAKFSDVRDVLSQIPNVKAVVPMGLDMATVTSPGELEKALGALRRAVLDEDRVAMESLKPTIRQIAEKLIEERKNDAHIVRDASTHERSVALIEPVVGDAFWAKFDETPLEQLEYLDTKVAPLTEEGRLMYFRYVGTDPQQFQENFERFDIVSGTMIPPGQRGFLFNQKYYDEWVKHYVARGFDRIHRGVVEEEHTIAEDPLLAALARQMKRQYRRISHQLNANEGRALAASLKAMMPSVEGDLEALLQAFLTLDDDNFVDRYAFFYREIAPKIDLYDVKVGDVMTIRAFTRAGFLKAVNVKLFGTFRFKGLEKSDLAGGHSLVDLVTFRELYGLMSKERRQELAAIKQDMALDDITADDAEAALFAGNAAIEATAEPGADRAFDEFADVDLAGTVGESAQAMRSGYTQREIDDGMALNVAVVLKDGDRLKETMAEASSALEAAGRPMRVVDWQTASGIVGQFIWVIRFVLYLSIAVIFAVALVIINNSMASATMERATEIGTLRAIGAQRSMVVGLFLLETVVLGVLAGAVGAALGVGTIAFLGFEGIPANGDVMTFLFGGPRLFPFVGSTNVVFAGVVILLVSVISTLYPAYMAARIQPVVAMSAKE